MLKDNYFLIMQKGSFCMMLIVTLPSITLGLESEQRWAYKKRLVGPTKTQYKHDV